MARLVQGLTNARLQKTKCVVIREQLRLRFSTASPLAKAASSSILLYQFEPDLDPENILLTNAALSEMIYKMK